MNTINTIGRMSDFLKIMNETETGWKNLIPLDIENIIGKYVNTMEIDYVNKKEYNCGELEYITNYKIIEKIYFKNGNLKEIKVEDCNCFGGNIETGWRKHTKTLTWFKKQNVYKEKGSSFNKNTKYYHTNEYTKGLKYCNWLWCNKKEIIKRYREKGLL